MAIIYSYPDNTNILLTDLLIGTSTVRIAGKKKNLTKNFTVEALGNFISLNNPPVWGTIIGNLENQTDLWNALESKQGNITLTTEGIDGPSTFIADVLNIPDYSAGMTVPSLDEVLTVGNTSLLDAKVGELYLYDTANTDYGKITNEDAQFKAYDYFGNRIFIASSMDSLFTVINSGNKSGAFNSLPLTDNRIYDLPDQSGTIALTSDITGGTLQQVTDAGNTTTNSISIIDNEINIYQSAPSAGFTSTSQLTPGNFYLTTIPELISDRQDIATFNSSGVFLQTVISDTNYVSDFIDGSINTSWSEIVGSTSGGVNLTGGGPGIGGGKVTFYKNGNFGSIRINNITGNIGLEFPNKAVGGYTIATTSDIGTWGALNYPTWTTGTPFVKMTAAGTFALDTNTYLTSITSSDVTTALGYTPVTNARTLTINGVGYDLTADRSWTIATNAGTVTSVGMTVPSAFSVTPSSITTSGTFAITGAGVASQYVRGDGTLANFPTSTGGGASVSYYLNGSVSQGTIGGVAYKEINSTPVIGAGTDFTINADGYIAQFITDVGDPNKLLIPSGNWNFETYFSASSSGGSPRFYIELYKYNGATFTLIASNSATPENITGGTAIDLYFTAIAVPSTVLLATDRLAVRFYVIHSGRTITMHTEDNHLSQIITTFSTGLTTLNGLTSQAQYFAIGTTGTDFNISSATDTHTFNLPSASATDRGLVTINGQTFAGAKTFSTAPILSSLTASQLLALDASNNIQSLSTATYPSLTELSYVKGTTSSIQTQIGTKINSSQAAYTMLANNTASTADVTTKTFRDAGEQTYTGTAVWTGGTAPVTGTLKYRWSQIGSCVSFTFTFFYATAGALNTSVTFDFPADMPAPTVPTGFSGASVFIYKNLSVTSTTATSTTNIGGYGGIRRNAGNTAFEFNYTYTTATGVKVLQTTSTYYTA
jgi:hypothetical protein